MIPLNHYLVLGALLFAIAVAGIFLNRKNLIVILMAIELMLLSVNMNFIAFSHFLGDPSGQVFVFFILTVAAAESAIGLAILVTLFRNLQVDRRRRPRLAQGMRRAMELMTVAIIAAFAPLAGAALAGFLGLEARPRLRAHGDDRLGRDLARGLARAAARGGGGPLVLRRALHLARRQGWSIHVGFLVDRLTAVMMVRGHLRLAHGARLHHRLHGRRPRLPALLRLHLALHLLDADAGDGGQLPAALLRLGGGGPGLLPPHRLLVQAPDRHLREPQGLPREPRGRLRVPAGHRLRVRVLRHARLRRGLHEGARRSPTPRSS